jgi:hypothetical protein
MNGIGGISQKGFTFSKEKAAIGKTSFASSIFNIQTENIGTVQSDVNGLLLGNSTLASALVTQQLSPPIVLQGNGWGTTSSVSQDVRFRMDVVPLSGSNAGGNFRLHYSLNNGSYQTAFELSTAQGATFYNSVTFNGQITTNSVLTTSQGLSGSNYYFGNVSGYTQVSNANYLLAGSSNVTNRVLLCGSNNTGSLLISNSHGSLIIGANTATEAASGNHAIISNLAVRPINVTDGSATTTDVASLYVDGPSTHSGSVSGGLYSILVASGVSKLNGNLYCNGIFTNTGATSANAYCELKAGTTTVAPLKITQGTNMTSAARGAIEFNGSHYETNVSFLRYGKGGSVNESTTSQDTVGTTETDLFSYTSPAGFFTNIGDKCNIDLGGAVVGNANGKTFKFSFGGTVIFNTGALTLATNAAWHISIKLIMSGSSKVKYIVSMFTDKSVSLVSSGELTGGTLTVSNIIKLTGTGVANGDISFYTGQVLYFPVSNP